jgi:excisionase family DNA binding protein
MGGEAEARQTYGLREVCKLLGVSYTSGQMLAQSGEMPIKPFRIGRRYYFRKADVDRFLGIDGAGDTTGRPADRQPAA